MYWWWVHWWIFEPHLVVICWCLDGLTPFDFSFLWHSEVDLLLLLAWRTNAGALWIMWALSLICKDWEVYLFLDQFRWFPVLAAFRREIISSSIISIFNVHWQVLRLISFLCVNDIIRSRYVSTGWWPPFTNLSWSYRTDHSFLFLFIWCIPVKGWDLSGRDVRIDPFLERIFNEFWSLFSKYFCWIYRA